MLATGREDRANEVIAHLDGACIRLLKVQPDGRLSRGRIGATRDGISAGACHGELPRSLNSHRA